MKFKKTADFVIAALNKCFTFSVSLSVVLAAFCLFVFFNANVTAGIQSERENINEEKQAHSAPEAGSAESSLNQPIGDPGSRLVRIGVYENKPKIYTDDTGAVAGLFVEILEEIARQENWQLDYVPCVWDEGLEALGNGGLDLMPDVAFSPERAEKFDYNQEEVITSWSVVYAGDEKEMSKISDLDGKRIAILKDSIHHEYLEQLLKGFGFKAAFVFADSFEEAFSFAAGGNADGVVTNHLFGDSYHQQYGLRKTPIVFNPVSLYFATASGSNSDLLSAIDRHLRIMKAEPGSVYYRAVVSWMEKEPTIIVPWYHIWIIAGICGLLILAFMFVVLLRWQVRAGTRNLAEANKRLVTSEKKFRDIFHQHSAVKLLIDPENGSIVEANKAAEEFYGWSVEQLRRMRIQDIDLLSVDEVRKKGEQASSGKLVHSEFRHKLADGSVRDVAVFCSGIDIEGKSLIHAIVQDITAQRTLEEQLQHARKMEAVGQLAGGVAHDYNNMLSVILGYTELAMEKADPSDPLCEDLQEVIKAASRSSEITRQLLGFARKQNAAPRAIDLNETVEGMLNMIRRLIGENILLEWMPGEGLWHVKMDPVQVDQILVNLCLNARDSISDNGSITIGTENVALDQKFACEHADFIPGEFVLLSVCDDGCGMDRETLSHVFEPFFTTKGLGKGTGLGLATIYGIVKQNNGLIKAESEPGEGTTVRIYLPRTQDKVEAISVETESGFVGSGLSSI